MWYIYTGIFIHVLLLRAFYIDTLRSDTVYNKYKKELFTVHDLSIKRNTEEDEWQKSQGFEIDPSDTIRLTQIARHNSVSDRELSSYLKSLSSEAIKVIVTAMYMGRDYMPETEEEYEKRMLYNSESPDDIIEAPSLKSDKPSELFADWFTEFSDWDDNRCICALEEKITIDRYLSRTFDILGIR